MRLFELGMWEIALMTALLAGALALLCVFVSVAVMMVVATLEAVEDYKNRRKW